MLRALTAGCICLVAGIERARQLCERAKTLRAWQCALENLGASCAYLRLPPEENWRSAIAQAGVDMDASVLTKEERMLLVQCQKAVYDGTPQQQERQLRDAAARFAQLLKSAQEKQEKDAGLYASIGLLGGLCVFLMCI